MYKRQGYVRPQILEDEYLTAIPKGGNEKTDTVTVTRQDDGTLTDDYPNIAVRPYYEQMITDYIEDYFGSDKIKVFSKVTETTIEDLDNISAEKMKGNVSSSNKIFIDGSVCKEKEVNIFTSELSMWSVSYTHLDVYKRQKEKWHITTDVKSANGVSGKKPKKRY